MGKENFTEVPKRTWIDAKLPCGETKSTDSLLNSIYCNNDSCSHIKECQRIVKIALQKTFASVFDKKTTNIN